MLKATTLTGKTRVIGSLKNKKFHHYSITVKNVTLHSPIKASNHYRIKNFN